MTSYFDDVQIQHVPSYAYGEEIALLIEESRDRFSLTQSYVRFTARIKKGEAPWASPIAFEEAADVQNLSAKTVSLGSGWRWFLSYNSRDAGLVQRLEAALRRSNREADVIFTPTSVRAGGWWLPELAKGIAEASGFVLLVGEHGLVSWQAFEYYEAMDRRAKDQHFPIILVLLEGQPAPGLSFLRSLPWIVSPDPTSEKAIAQLADAAAGGGHFLGELWRYTAPYRGLEALDEKDSDYFFGRERETAEVIQVLADDPGKLPVLLGNSGVGKTSVAQAGALATLMRESWPENATAARPWPVSLSNSRHWCLLKLRPGTRPVQALVESFARVWQLDATGLMTRVAELTEALVEGRAALSDLIAATDHRLEEIPARTRPPVYLVYVDQGEELYVRAEEPQRRRFTEIVAEGLRDVRFRAFMSMRSDFLGQLQHDQPLFSVYRPIDVPPMREAELRQVVSRPAELLGARFESDRVPAYIAQRAADESSKDAGTLPLLSYLLDDMWKSKDPSWDGVLRLPAPAIELGQVLVDRASVFLVEHPGAEDALRRIFTLKLATVREDGEPMRRRALRSEFSEDEWRLVTELADHPNRLLVTATPDAGEAYAEVAHEAIFSRWDRLRQWIAAEREFLAWRSRLETARRAWATAPDRLKVEALLMGAALVQAQNWLGKRAVDLPTQDRQFIQLSIARQRRARRMRTVTTALLIWILLGLVGWINQSYIAQQWRWWTVTRPYAVSQVWPSGLSASTAQALKPRDSFKECASECPEMIVIPAGSFTMGSPETEDGRSSTEGPQHQVSILRPFAVSRFQLTFADWDACVGGGGCGMYIPHDQGWGRGRQPVIFVSWEDARRYVTWLSQVTRKTYRLLSEAEYEYGTRAGTSTKYLWGENLGIGNANCDGCGSKWDNKLTAPVGSFAPNAFGLYDMVGNVFEWVEDCWHNNYVGAPSDGSARLGLVAAAQTATAESSEVGPGTALQEISALLHAAGSRLPREAATWDFVLLERLSLDCRWGRGVHRLIGNRHVRQV
jgi:formylglycine-generating enzyme required for sulfatase activity